MLLAVACLLLSGLAWAGDTEYQRGDYKFSVGPVPAFVQRHELPAQWDPKAFHKILTMGAMPLTVLEKVARQQRT